MRDVLTPRQTDVLVLIIERRTAPEIAGQLGIKQSTVKTLRVQAYKRLGVHNRDDASAAFAALTTR